MPVEVIVSVVGGLAAVVAAAIAAWATLRARRKLDGEVSCLDVRVNESEAILAEQGADVHLLSELIPDRPALDITVSNDGDRKLLVRRIRVELKGLLHVPPVDPPTVLRLPGARMGGVLERRLGPSGSYALNFPLQQGSYGKTVNHLIDPGDSDRFIMSLVATEAEQGMDFYQVRLLIEGGRTRKARNRAASEPMMVLAYGPPSWESPIVIKERLSQIADTVREQAPQGSAELSVFFNSALHPNATGMEDYVAFYETKLEILTDSLQACLKHAADETHIWGWLNKLKRDLAEVEQLRRHAADLRASGRHP
ncbi:hypothetical protein [Streptomyces sp. NRRL B-24720]|uniref:hypothetical protein n=1 Tax=Streptomyces sp. NRRL B-24720 TaxID=1476876 RepID=UPI0004CB1A0A|nr:hypothetical protein [Streptomyces sp. NRRL B-24720]